jgi:hypothetical protein
MKRLQAPLLAPALIIIERKALLPEHEDLEGKGLAQSRGSKGKAIFVCLYAAITMIALFGDSPLDSLRLKLCWLFAQIILYWGMSHKIAQSDRLPSQISTDVLHTATALATVMVVITTPLVVLWWHHMPSAPQVGMIGILKACRWMAVLVLVSNNFAAQGRNIR